MIARHQRRLARSAAARSPSAGGAKRDADCRQDQHHIGGFRWSSAHQPRAGELDEIGGKCRRDDQLDAGEAFEVSARAEAEVE
jgi:hypothetical protein